jgi:hypothetical protein
MIIVVDILADNSSSSAAYANCIGIDTKLRAIGTSVKRFVIGLEAHAGTDIAQKLGCDCVTAPPPSSGRSIDVDAVRNVYQRTIEQKKDVEVIKEVYRECTDMATEARRTATEYSVSVHCFVFSSFICIICLYPSANIDPSPMLCFLGCRS